MLQGRGRTLLFWLGGSAFFSLASACCWLRRFGGCSTGGFIQLPARSPLTTNLAGSPKFPSLLPHHLVSYCRTSQLHEDGLGFLRWCAQVIVAAGIELEFRRVDKTICAVGNRTVIVTDSWLLQTSTYTLDVAHKHDVDLSLETVHHAAQIEAADPLQILRIRVTSAHRHSKPFVIRLKASDFTELQDQLTQAIRNTRDLTILLSPSDRFVTELCNLVGQNPPHLCSPDEADDTCIGCMLAPVAVKIRQHCERVEGRQPCTTCNCRPMWCLKCLAKWFVNRQDQSQPESWLAGVANCPTCHATFCARDVSTLAVRAR
eukprot:m.133667 g.133667  ORF g.133667 m.133667 type:complete len:317 (-) comp52423_c0_seq6:146-1096(-)